MHLDFCLLRSCAAKATSSRSSTCTCDQESTPTESSSSVIPHQKMVNKVFGKRSTRLIDHLLKFVITYLFIRRTPTIVVCNAPSSKVRGVFSNLVVEEEESSYIHLSLIMYFILSMMICICIILLNNLLQCLICIVMVDLSSTCDCTIILICKSLVMFMSYF
jgi:hypothetical protein